MTAQIQPRITPQQYLELERASDVKHEYYNGQMFEMAGATYNHIVIAGNLSGLLYVLRRNTRCRVLTSDMRIRVSEDGLYTYPDIVVSCDEPEFADNTNDTLLNPVVIVEVLSPSSEAYDRGFKATQYRKLPALREYLLVSQFAPHIETFSRQEDGRWLLSECDGLQASCPFASLNGSIALVDIYEGVVFSESRLRQ